jgi:hypothetical protein
MFNAPLSAIGDVIDDSGATVAFYVVDFTVFAGAGSANYALAWAQSSSDAGATTLLKGSNLIFTRLQ